MFSNTSLNFISDLGLTDHKIKYRISDRMLFKKQVLFEVSYFTRNIYVIETVTSGLSYIEDSNIVKYIIQYIS